MTIVIAVAAAVALASALGVVLSARTIYSALSLVVNVGSLAVIFLTLNAQFLFAVQLIIYAGAVMVLFVFIIALLSPDDEEHNRWTDWRFYVGAVAAIGFTVAIGWYGHVAVEGSQLHGQVAGSASNPYHSFGFSVATVDDPKQSPGQVQVLGQQLFTTFLLPFEITSLLLFVAAIGAVYLTRRHASEATVRRTAARDTADRGAAARTLVQP